MLAKVSFEFLKEKSGSVKADFGDDRVLDMSGKPEFADIAAHGIVLADVTLAGQKLRQGVNAAAGGNRAQKQALPGLERAWNRMMRKVGNYVTVKAQEKDTIEEQVAIIVLAGFAYTKIKRGRGVKPGLVTGFRMLSKDGYPAMVQVESDSAGRDVTYISVFHRRWEALDAITVLNDQLELPANENFIIHVCTNSYRTLVRLTSGQKWYGCRYAVNKTGRGPTSGTASAIPQ